MVPLCVPIRDKDIAKRAGARYNPTERVWECAADLLNHPALQPYIPRMHRPGLVGPVIRPWLVPSPLWGINLRALLPKQQWDVVRRDAYARAGKRCIVCGGRGDKWPVEADEAWDYDDERCVQTLKGVIALCPRCHQIRHWGSTEIKGQRAGAYAQLIRVNRWSTYEADRAIETAFELWEQRSQKAWTSDFSWVQRHYDFEITEEGFARAQEVHKSFPNPFQPPAVTPPPEATPALEAVAIVAPIVLPKVILAPAPRATTTPSPRSASWTLLAKLRQTLRRPWN